MTTFEDLARQLWPNAELDGDGGPYAVVIEYHGATQTVVLYTHPDDALDLRNQLVAGPALQAAAARITIHQLTRSSSVTRRRR